MSKFVFGSIILAVLVIGGVAYSNKSSDARQPLLGAQHADQGRAHLTSLSEKHVAYNSELPSSGPHYFEDAPWGIKGTTVPDEQMVHNLEHGGIVITYKPDLPQDQLSKLKQIASSLTSTDSPHAVKGFKVLTYPRAKNSQAIEMASWRYTFNMDQVNAQSIKIFYRQHLNKAPEPNAD